jgi:Skp family chaperone for outer membrane proteins
MIRLFGALSAALLCLPLLPAQNLGWIDVQKVIFDYKKTKDITEQLEKKMAAHAATIRQDQEKIKGLMESLELTGADGDPLERLKSEKNIKLAQVDLEIQEKNVRFQLEQDLVLHMKKVYKEVVREAEAIARERKFAFIFMINKGEVEGRTREEVSGNILVRPILYADPALDLTSEVIQRLNK